MSFFRGGDIGSSIVSNSELTSAAYIGGANIFNVLEEERGVAFSRPSETPSPSGGGRRGGDGEDRGAESSLALAVSAVTVARPKQLRSVPPPTPSRPPQKTSK